MITKRLHETGFWVEPFTFESDLSPVIPHIFVRLPRILSKFKISKNGLERATSDRISCREYCNTPELIKVINDILRRVKR